jgi:hypothetical protein
LKLETRLRRRSMSEPSQSSEPVEDERAEDEVDMDALTAAVERLLRRDLAIERERLRGARG